MLDAQSESGEKMFSKKNKKPLVQFVTTIPGLETIEDTLPRPSKAFIPQWWKDIPSDAPQTVKVCPSFPDYFSQGFIVPMWMDTKIRYSKETEFWSAESPGNDFQWQTHGNMQALNYVEMPMQGKETNFIFKAICPWRIITPPGYSVLQLPLFYHFNKQYSVLPGIIDTDIHHEINQQVLYHGNGEDISILRGDPFVLYIPFERKKYDYSVGAATDEQIKMFNAMGLNIITKPFRGAYREMQRKRDAKLAKS